MPPFPWEWLAEAAAASAGGNAQISQDRPNLKRHKLVSRVLDCCPRRERHLHQVTTLLNSLIRQGFLRETETNVWNTSNSVTISDRAPTPNDDRSDGYHEGDWWWDEALGILWICVDATIGLGVWVGLPFSRSPSSTSGTVTSATGPGDILEWSGANTALLTASKKSQSANTVFAGPNGASGIPAFRALVSADIPAGVGGTDIGCRLKNSGTQAVSAAATTALTFDQEDYDTDTMHDTGANTSRITITTAGKYTIWFGFRADFGAAVTPTAGAYQRAIIYKNGSATNHLDLRTAVSATGSADTYYSQLHLMIEDNYAATDYLEVFCHNSDGANGITITKQYFGARKVDKGG